MRNIDFDKCWPFRGDGGGGNRSRSLPEISVRKFRFWTEELKTEEVSGDGEEAAALVKTPPSSKTKQRTPKKRSIVELFAVAPPMEAAETDGSGGDDEEKKMEEEVKGKEDVVMKIKKMKIRKKRKKKKKRKLKIEICAAKKVLFLSLSLLKILNFLFFAPFCLLVKCSHFVQ